MARKQKEHHLDFTKKNQAVLTDTLNRNAIENTEKTVKGEQWPVKKCNNNLLEQN